MVDASSEKLNNPNCHLLHLDNCCFNRPYDDQTILSIFLETEAILFIQDLIRDEKLKIV